MVQLRRVSGTEYIGAFLFKGLNENVVMKVRDAPQRYPNAVLVNFFRNGRVNKRWYYKLRPLATLYCYTLSPRRLSNRKYRKWCCATLSMGRMDG